MSSGGWINIKMTSYQYRKLKLTKMSYLNGQHLCDLFATVPSRGRQLFIVLIHWITVQPRLPTNPTKYRKSHCGDKTILWLSYLHNGISYTGKTTSLYWIGAQQQCFSFDQCILMIHIFQEMHQVLSILGRRDTHFCHHLIMLIMGWPLPAWQLCNNCDMGKEGVPQSRFNTLWPRQNGCNFTDNIFKFIFLNEIFWILNKILLKYVRYGLIDNMAALVQIMSWCRTSDKPLSEPMLACFTDAYMRHSASVI